MAYLLQALCMVQIISLHKLADVMAYPVRILKKSNGRSTTPLGADKMFAEEAVFIVGFFNTNNNEEVKVFFC